jgi:8-oxo-dGTP pyrophosphatase MutT (NUDIX family)
MAAAAVILDEANRVLLVQPVYYPGRWLMPGGAGEPDESPRQTCLRELAEELGIGITPGRLLAIDWIPAHTQGFAELIYVFSGGRLTQQQIESIQIPEGELTEHRFMPLREANSGRRAPPDGRLYVCARAPRTGLSRARRSAPSLSNRPGHVTT